MRVFVRTLLALFSGALIALLTIFVLMNYTDLGRRTTARVGFWTAGYFSGYNLRCGAFAGNLFSAFTCREFVLSDRNGVFFSGRELAIDWRFAPILSRRFSAQLVRLSDAVMIREPESDDDGEPFQLFPDWPNVALEIGRLELERITLRFSDKPEICFGGGGTVNVAEPVLDINTEFARCGGEGSLRAMASYRDNRLTIDARALDDGIVANFLFGWAGAGRTELTIAGNGPIDSFAGTLDANVTDGGEANLRVNTVPLGQGQAFALTATGNITLAEGRAPSWAPARDGEVSLRMVLNEGGGIRVDEGLLRWGGSRLRFEVVLEENTRRLEGQIDAALGMLGPFEAGNVSLVLRGTRDSPTGQLTYTINGFHAGDVLADELEGRATLAAENGLERIRFSSQGTAENLLIADFINSAIGAETSFDITGRYIAADEALEVMGSAQGQHVRASFDADLAFENDFVGSADAEIFVAEAGEISGIHVPGGATFNLALTELRENGEAVGSLAVESTMLAADGAFERAAGGAFEANFATTRIDPAQLGQATGWEFVGAPSLRVAVTGSLSEPVMAFEADAPTVSRGILTLTDAEATSTISRSMRIWSADTRIVSGSSLGAVNIDAVVSWGGGEPVRIALRDSTLAGAGLGGEANSTAWRGPWQGTINVRDRPLAPFAAFFDREITSNGTITINLVPAGEEQRINAAIAVRGMRSGTAFIDAALNGRVSFNLSTDRVDAELSLADRDDSLRATADGLIGDMTLVTLRTLEGRWTNLPVRLTAPAEIRSDNGNLTLTPAQLDVAGGRLEISGERVGEALSARASLAALPAGPIAVLFNWSDDAQGRIDGTARVSFTPTGAQGRLELAANDLAFAGQERGLEPADVALTADWNGSLLTLNGTVTGLDSAPAELKGTMPLARVPGSFAVDFPDEGTVSGTFTAMARAERLFALLPLPEHRLTGALSVSLNVSGDIARPDIGGRAVLENGTYESLELGTRLEKLNVGMVATPDGALALSANASDGGEGTFALNGRVSLVGARVTVNGLLSTVNADLARTDEYVARGTSNLTIARGTEGPVRITGTARTSEVRFDLGQPLPQGVEEVAVIETNRPPDLVVFQPDRGPELLHTAELNIDIDMPSRVFVTGYGVNAEWRGNVEVRGTLGDPTFQGQLNLVRGDAEVLGRDFQLEQGLVTIDPTAAGNARIRIIGAHRQPGFTVRVTADGTAAQPRLEWSSTPVLPRDEILARLYFGRASPNLSAYEAVQLAQLSGVIGGFGGGGGVLGFARRVVGLDVLRVDAPVAGTEGGPRLAVGKYITDRVYVGAVSGADTSSGAIEVEVRVTPNITVEVETGADARNAAGINWERDY